MNLLNLKEGPIELFQSYEFCFEALVSKFNAHSTSLKILVSLTAFIPENSYGDNSQHISVLAAAALPAESPESDTTTDDVLKAISYDLIAFVHRQCDPAKTADQPSNIDSFLHANSASVNSHDGLRKGRARNVSARKSLLT